MSGPRVLSKWAYIGLCGVGNNILGFKVLAVNAIGCQCCDMNAWKIQP